MTRTTKAQRDELKAIIAGNFAGNLDIQALALSVRPLLDDLDAAEAQRARAESELDAERKLRVEAEEAATRAEAERDALRKIAEECCNATDGGCSPGVTVEFLRGVPKEVEFIKKQRDDARAKLERAETLLRCANDDCRLADTTIASKNTELIDARAKLAALVEAVDTEIDNVDHENYPLCGVHDGSRLVERHLSGSDCTCGVQKIRAAIAAARGGAK